MRVFNNCRIYRYDPSSRTYSRFDGMLCEDAAIRSLNPGDAGTGVASVDLERATVLPALADCHVHLTATGLQPYLKQ